MGVGLGLLGALASPAAAVRTVTLETDNNTTGSVPGELRYEIGQAVPGELVQIAPNVNPELSPLGAVTGGGQILIDKDLIIEGQGADQTYISVPTLTSRIFIIFSMSSTLNVTIRDLRLSGGRAPSGSVGPTPGSNGTVGQSGGAIFNSEQLTLSRVRFALNFGGNGGAGAVGATSNPGGTGGTGGGGGSGGALLNTVGGVVNIMNSTFEDNQAGDGGNGGQGGPSDGSGMIDVAGTGGTGGIGQDGGAISNAGAMTVTNSTFFSNESGRGGEGGDRGSVGVFGSGGNGGASGDGGAIHQAGAGSLTLSNVTIAENVASDGGMPGTGADPPFPQGVAGAGGTGGGTFFNTGPSSIVVANTLYSQNTATPSTAANCAGPGPVTVQGANLAFPAMTGCPGSFSSGNPQLGTLMNNGGPTPTMALGTGSAAIDTALTGPAADQRGVSRPQGARCDIGAFELEQPTIPGSTCAGPPPASPLIPPTTTTPLATGLARKKCKKGRKLKKGRCVKKKRKK